MRQCYTQMPTETRPGGETCTWQALEAAFGGGLHRGKTWTGVLDPILCLAGFEDSDLARYRGYPCPVVPTTTLETCFLLQQPTSSIILLAQLSAITI
jgi:hypothetical protein